MDKATKATDLISTFGKELAVKVVNEIIDAIDWHDYEVPATLQYWSDVRDEVEKRNNQTCIRKH